MSAPPPPAPPDPSWRRPGQPRPGVAELLLEIAGTSVTEHDAEALLREVCGRLTWLAGLAGCAAVVFDGSTGAVRILVASHPEAEQLTRLVQQLGLGIGSAAIRAGRDTALDDLTRSTHAGLADASARVGLPVTAVVALRGGDELVGCLQLFGRDLDTLAGGLLGELAPLAEVLGAVLGNIEAYRHSASLVASLSTALDRQGPIEQAKGMLAERHAIDLDAAYRMLREQAYRQATSVVAVAAELVNQSWRGSSQVPESGADAEWGAGNGWTAAASQGTEETAGNGQRAVPGQNGAELAGHTAEGAPLPEQRGGPIAPAEVESHPAG
ncbi:MAG TPA: ANTAR domain-containing protein [Pseudonocardia sp.]|nr:ANTAR domain-containing protein [Pseudonocardia sp.]